ncbi:MAG: energy transducer TonB [Gemmatimonadota bacterium]|nr:energy transducer TonB [Gemmatimonadota bacterium]MDH3421735.1 energy transducer TonB [Gemmatimonadota bacterium]
MTRSLSALAVVLAAAACSGSSSSLRSAAPAESVVSAPRLTNGDEVAAAIEAEYPSQFRNDGVGGTVRLRLLVDTNGVPVEVRLLESSGYPALDAAGDRVASILRFDPARDAAGRPIRVWASFPIIFQAR